MYRRLVSEPTDSCQCIYAPDLVLNIVLKLYSCVKTVHTEKIQPVSLRGLEYHLGDKASILHKGESSKCVNPPPVNPSTWEVASEGHTFQHHTEVEDSRAT